MERKILYNPADVLKLMTKDEVILIDVRPDVIYEISHIKGAYNLHEAFSYLSRSDKEGLNKLHNYFQDKFSEIGITDDKLVVFYDNDVEVFLGASSRGYYILNYLGYKNCGILDGGIHGWIQKGYPIESGKNKLAKDYNRIDINPDENIFITADELKKKIKNEKLKIIDNRDLEEWEGDIISPYGDQYIVPKGRIPGSIWIEWRNFLKNINGISYFKSIEEIVEVCKKYDLNVDDEIIIYCFKGSRSSNTYTALKLAGFKNIKNYFASWYDWSQFEETPKELI